MRVLILGAGGHGQVVADILLRQRDLGQSIDPVGYLDDDEKLAGCHILGLPVIGNLNHSTMIPHDAIITAVGDNSVRQRIFGEFVEKGESFATAVHPSSIIAPDASIGFGSQICAGVIVNTGADVGINVILNTACSIDHHCQIDNGVHVAPGARLGGNVNISEGALIGIGAIVLPGRSVGAWSQVSAGAIVNHDIPDGVTVVGAPARIISKHTRSTIK